MHGPLPTPMIILTLPSWALTINCSHRQRHRERDSSSAARCAYIASSNIARRVSSTQLTVIPQWSTPELSLTTSVVSPQLHLGLPQLPHIYTHTYTHMHWLQSLDWLAAMFTHLHTVSELDVTLFDRSSFYSVPIATWFEIANFSHLYT